VSHVTLRRLMIRLLHDPTLVAQLRYDPDRALAGLALGPAEREAVLAVPDAGWRTDPDRPHRVLHALADEFPASLAVSEPPGREFFASPEFHTAVQDRGSLAVAFGAFLERTGTALAGELARLETAIARVRRAPAHPDPSPSGTARLAPYAAIVITAAGAVRCLEAVRAGGPATAVGTLRSAFLVLRGTPNATITIEPLEDGLHGLLEFAQMPCLLRHLHERAVALGASTFEARTIVDDLIASHLLV
jgi:hypothetical protein